jgi:hypothetical protein
MNFAVRDGPPFCTNYCVYFNENKEIKNKKGVAIGLA